MMSDYGYHIGHRVKQCQRPAITGNGRRKNCDFGGLFMALFDPHDCGLITTSCHDGTGIRNAGEWIGETIPK